MRHRRDPGAQTSAAPSRSRGLLLLLLLLLLGAVLAAALSFLVLPNQAQAAQSKVEAETMSRSGRLVMVHPNSMASGGQEVAFYTNGSASSRFDGAATNVTLRARGEACSGNPQLKVYVDGALKGTVNLTSNAFADYAVAFSGLSGGTHTLRISFENDYYKPNECGDRNAYLDYYVLTHPDSPPPSGSSPVLVGAGDIASGDNQNDEATAKLLGGISGTVFTAGDNAYDSGTSAQFSNYYNPTWGRYKARTKPSVGNHDYGTAGASGYFKYFGAAAGDPKKGYYSYNLGAWHIVVLNSMCENVGGCGAASPMVTWLKQDLAANTKTCTLSYWHHPVFSSGSEHGNDPKMRPSWDSLYAAGAEVVVNGHDHDYERFAPQSPSAALDNARGIREFVVGTGGRSLRPFGTIRANSQVRNAATYGVLKLTLNSNSYDWKFVPVAGQTFTDSGTTSCH